MTFRSMSLRLRLTLAFSLLFIFLFGVLWLALKLLLDQTLSQQTRTLGEILAKQTADAVTELVLANDLLGLNVVLGQLSREPGVTSVTITDVDGRTLATTLESYTTLPLPRYEAPITLQDAVAGRVVVTLDDALLSNPLARPPTLFYAIIVLGLTLVAWLAWTLAYSYRDAILGLSDLLAHPEAADSDSPVAALPARELDLLQEQILDLLQHQQRLEATIATAALPDPDELQQLALRAERRACTLVLVEVQQIQTAVELLHPATLSTLLQEFQFYLRQAARLYRGNAVRVDGHRMLLSFDERHCQDEHAFAALCCAQLFLHLMRVLAARHRAANAQSLEFGIAVHSGDCYYSPLWRRRREGREARREESVIGKPADLIYQLLPHCAGGQVLATALSVQLAGGAERFGVPESTEMQAGPDKLPVMAYSLDADAGNHSGLLIRQCQHIIPDQDSVN